MGWVFGKIVCSAETVHTEARKPEFYTFLVENDPGILAVILAHAQSIITKTCIAIDICNRRNFIKADKNQKMMVKA